MTGRSRLDVLLVERQLMPSRARAQAAINAGLVAVDERVVTRPSELVSREAAITARQPHPWVSRGGIKLAAALDHFGVSPAGRHCLDIGASTGGFTEVLLARGAASVVCVDVGRGQLSGRIAGDPRVTPREATDARAISPEEFVVKPDLLVADVSFISLLKVIARPLACLSRPSEAVLLVKPQFEVGPHSVGKGGLVAEDAARIAVTRVATALASDHGLVVRGTVDSAIRGGDGNLEAFVHATLPAASIDQNSSS